MQCTACGGPLETSPNGAYSRCTSCKALYMVWQGSLTPVAIPPGSDAEAFHKGIGFDGGIPTPMESAKASFGQHIANSSVSVKVGGVKVGLGREGVSVDPTKAVKEVRKEVERTISGWIWGCAFSVFFFFAVGAVIVCLGGYVGWTIYRTTPGSAGAPEVAEWDGTSPYSCAGSDEVTISGTTANLPGRTAITAAANCKLTLVGVDVSADIALDVAGNAQVTVTGGRLAGSTAAIRAGANGKVDLSGTTVEGPVERKASAVVNGP